MQQLGFACAGLKVQEPALAALGCLAVARPAVLADSLAQALLQQAMHSSSPVALKTRALAVLLDMLRVGLTPCTNSNQRLAGMCPRKPQHASLPCHHLAGLWVCIGHVPYQCGG